MLNLAQQIAVERCGGSNGLTDELQDVPWRLGVRFLDIGDAIQGQWGLLDIAVRAKSFICDCLPFSRLLFLCGYRIEIDQLCRSI